MANVVDLLLPGLLQDKVDHGWEVVHCHFMKAATQEQCIGCNTRRANLVVNFGCLALLVYWRGGHLWLIFQQKTPISPVLGETAEREKASLLPRPHPSLKGLGPPKTKLSGEEPGQLCRQVQPQQLCKPRAGSHQDHSNSSSPGDALSWKGMEH